MPTSQAPDRVAERLGIPCFETPTGWKFFGTLLDAGMATLCGEELRYGSNHVREKDGLWAVLFWLNVLAVRKASVADIVQQHWRMLVATSTHGMITKRSIAPPPAVDAGPAGAALRSCPSGSVPTRSLSRTTSPIPIRRRQYDGKAGHSPRLRDGSRIVFRLSGTGTEGATLRVYLEQFEPDASKHNRDTQQILGGLIAIARQVAGIEKRTGRAKPTVIT